MEDSLIKYRHSNYLEFCADEQALMEGDGETLRGELHPQMRLTGHPARFALEDLGRDDLPFSESSFPCTPP
jgi:hypothetical protein